MQYSDFTRLNACRRERDAENPVDREQDDDKHKGRLTRIVCRRKASHSSQ